MHAWILSLALCCGAGTDWADGTLLFLENSNSFVELYTAAPVGHVALLFAEQGATQVFEATPGRVRSLPLEDYLQELAQLNVGRQPEAAIRAKALAPKRPYTAAEVQAMREYLAEQMGRRYSVRNYVQRREGDGVHCAELAANTLNRTERFVFPRCFRETPTTLLNKVADQHQPAVELPLPELPAQPTWCERQWQWWGTWGRYCRWSWGEALSYCW